MEGESKLEEFVPSSSHLEKIRPDCSKYVSASQLSNMKVRWHQLIVIGNGFDLECGLASRFSDFFSQRRDLLFPQKKEIANSGAKNWGSYIHGKGMTVWDLILQGESKESWNDIEKAIARWVLPRSGFLSEDSFGKVLSYLREWERETSFIKKERYETYGGYLTSRNPQADIAKYIINVARSSIKEWNRQSLLLFSLEELHRLEHEFSVYLSSQVEDNLQYRSKAHGLLRSLCVQGLPSEEKFDISTSVLNFNYTNPLSPRLSKEGVTLVNIHGSLGGEIVFGIDGKDHMEDCGVVSFTKTYRLLPLNPLGSRRLFFSCGAGLSDSSTNVIKFYGHSLGEPDYSYFQSLFDAVNLYGSHTKLVFYYRPHGSSDDLEEQKREAQQRTFQAVTNLLRSYGETMDNDDHGKNLMHKLILEGRLSVKLLPQADPYEAFNE